MPEYEAQGMDTHGQWVSRRVVAGSEAEARQRMATDMEVLQLIPVESHYRRRRNGFELELFAQELLTLLEAGLSLIEALETLSDRQETDPVLPLLIRRLQEGRAFSQALAEYPDRFPDLFQASIAASEQTGDMPDALRRFLRYQEQINGVRAKLVSAAVYPALLIGVGTAVALFLLCYLVPRFSQVYESLDTELPLASRLLMEWGLFAARHPWGMTLGVGGGLMALGLLLSRPAVWAVLLDMAQRQPWLGRHLRLMQLSRFYRSLSLLLRGGVPLLKGLGMARPLLPPALRGPLDTAILAVGNGRSLSESLEQAGLTTPVAQRLLRAGERNGQVADMLERTAAFHDQETGRWIDRFTRLFEPLLMLLIGGLIGGIVILLYLPIFELAGSIQ